MQKIKLFFEQSIEQNASIYFNKSKKAKKKIEGAKKALKISEEKLIKLQTSHQKKLEQKKAKIEVKHEWYEKFRWFFTSLGSLVIGGRDATTNEIIIKKHTEPSNLIFHTDMAGSPFFVLKSPSPTKEEIKEVADATISFSRSWKLGLSSQNVFYVTPEQVTKQAKAGEYLTKGSFTIKGKTNYIDNKINLAIGQLSDNRLMCAPLESIKANCSKFNIIKQGTGKISNIAKKLKNKYSYPDLDSIIRILPTGGTDMEK